MSKLESDMIKRTNKGLSKFKAILLIALSGLGSVFLATAWIEFGAMELGALMYLFVPIVVAVASIAIFSLIDFFTPRFRDLLTVTFVIVNLMIGIIKRLDFY